MNRTIIIFTRMYAEKYSGDDEWVDFFGKNCDDPQKVFENHKRKLIMVHGYKEKFYTTGRKREIKNEAINGIKAIINEHLDKRNNDYIIIFHPGSGKDYDNIKKELKLSNIFKISSAGETKNIYEKTYKELIKDNKVNWNKFDELWSYYNIKSNIYKIIMKLTPIYIELCGINPDVNIILKNNGFNNFDDFKQSIEDKIKEIGLNEILKEFDKYFNSIDGLKEKIKNFVLFIEKYEK